MRNNDDVFMQFNPLIEEMIEERYREEGPGEAYLSVLQTILTAMEQEGHMLIPVETPDNALKYFDPDKIEEGQTVTVDEELHWTLINVSNDKGEVSMPVFTSQEKKDEAGLGACSSISYFLDEYMRQVLEMDGVEGMVINPGERGFFLSKQAIEMLLNAYKELKTHHTVSKDAFFIEPVNVPDGFLDMMSEFIANNFDEVEKVWFTGIRDGEDESWCFAIKAETEDIQPIFDRFHTMMVLSRIDMPVDYVAVEKAPWEGAEVVYEREGEKA